MLSVRQLSKTIDSLRNNEAYFLTRSGNDISPYLHSSGIAIPDW
jgi:hypothetical protein